MRRFVWVALAVPAALAQSGPMRLPAGVTRGGESIPSLVTSEDFDYETKKLRILIVGGGERAVEAVEDFYSNAGTEQLRGRMAVSALPNSPPDGYPPAGEHYAGKENGEAQYSWRWIGMHAPDLVVVLREGEPKAAAGADRLGSVLGAKGRPKAGSLAFECSTKAASNTGVIPAIEIAPSKGFLARIAGAVKKSGFSGPSPARREIMLRLKRSPLEIERELARTYGKDLPEAVYIPAMSLIGRLRLGDQARDATQLEMVEKIVEPYFSGSKESLAKATGSHLSGHLIFGELFQRTKKARYLDLVKAAANLGFEAPGGMKESMPMHNEMSDSVFMGTPIVAQAGRLTGDRRYYDMALRHMRFMLKLNLRPDGLHRHSPLDETAWGRGNGFPALGLALTLSELPGSFEGFPEVLAAFRAHMEAMLRHQDEAGMWHQVVDRPESYREFTVTAMTAFAMKRGVSRGWLDTGRFQPAINRAWYALKARTGRDGGLVDVCTGPGKQKSLRDYYDRGAILGPDPRGGGMAWLIASEMAN
jgi:rhamnogalacturonyl hydrolase YesR